MYCAFCHASTTLRHFEGSNVCQECYRALLGDAYRLILWLRLPYAR